MRDLTERHRDLLTATLRRGWEAPAVGLTGAWQGALPHDAAVAEAHDDGTATVYGRLGASRWDLATGALVDVIEGWSLPAVPYVVLPDPEAPGGRLAVTTEGDLVRWPSGRAERRWPTYVWDASVVGGGRYVLVERSGDKRLYELPSWRERARFEGRVLGFDRAATRVLVARDERVELLTLDGERLAETPSIPKLRRALVLADAALLHASGAMLAWRYGEGRPREVWSRGGSVGGRALALDDEDALLVVASSAEEGAHLVAVDVDGRERYRSPAPAALPLVARGGRCLALADERLVAADLAAGVARSSRAGHEGAVTAVAYGHGVGVAITASEDGAVRVWRAGGDGAAFALEGPATPAPSLALAPEGDRLHALAVDGRWSTWALRESSLESTVAAVGAAQDGDGPPALRLSPDGAHVAFTAPRGERVRVFSAHGDRGLAFEVTAPEGEAVDACFSRDGRDVFVVRWFADAAPDGDPDDPPPRAAASLFVHDARTGRLRDSRRLAWSDPGVIRLSDRAPVAWLTRASAPGSGFDEELARVDLETGEEHALGCRRGHLLLLVGDSTALVGGLGEGVRVVRLRDGALRDEGALWRPPPGAEVMAPPARLTPYSPAALSPDERELSVADVSGAVLRFALP